MRAPPAHRIGGISLTVIASILWGTSFLFIGFGLEDTDPYTLAFLRFAIAAVVIFPLSLFYKDLDIISELKRPGIWVVGVANALGYLFQFVGQSFSSAAEASLLSTLYPVIVPFLAFLFLKDRIGGLQKLSTALGFSGMILVMLPDINFHSLHFFGDILLLLTSIAYAVFIVSGKKVKSSSADSIFALMVIDTVLLSIPAVFMGHPEGLFTFGISGWLVVLWLAFPCTLIATWVYMKGLTYLPASQSATVLFLELVSGFVLSVVVFGEPHLLIRAAGAGIISISIIISSLSGSTNAEKEVPAESRSA